MRLSDVRLAKLLYDRVVATKRVSRCSLDDKGFHKMLMTVEAINYLNEDDLWFKGMHLQDMKIPVQFSGFIWPKAVRMYPSDKRSIDLLIRDNPATDVYNYDELLNAMLSICSAYKVNDPTLKSIYDLRVIKSLEDAMKEAEVGSLGLNWDGSRGRVPYKIIELSVMKNSYFNSDFDEVFDQYLREFPSFFN